MTIRVIPFDTDWYPGLEGASYRIESAHDSPVVFVEVRGTGLFLHSAIDIAACRQAATKLSEQTMSPEDSLVVIALAQAGWEAE